MTIKEIAFQLEKVQTRLWSLNSLTLAVNDAIVEGPNAASNFYGALHILTCMTHELEQEVNVLTKELFEVIKKDTAREVA